MDHQYAKKSPIAVDGNKSTPSQMAICQKCKQVHALHSFNVKATNKSTAAKNGNGTCVRRCTGRISMENYRRRRSGRVSWRAEAVKAPEIVITISDDESEAGPQNQE